MGLHSLVLSADADVVRVLERVLGELGMEVYMCGGPDEATDLLSRHKFDAIILDCDDLAGAREVLENLRKTASNRASMSFAIVNGITSLRQAFDLGANFVLDKPLTIERAQRSFRAAQGLIMRERRRYFRHPVEAPVWLDFGHGVQMQASANNLSEGGMAIRYQGTLPNMNPKVSFELPETGVAIEAKAEVAWSDSQGHAGLRFRYMHAKMRLELETWLADRYQEGEPMARFLSSSARWGRAN